jgi:hypothetical protein
VARKEEIDMILDEADSVGSERGMSTIPEASVLGEQSVTTGRALSWVKGLHGDYGKAYSKNYSIVGSFGGGSRNEIPDYG